MDNRVQLNTAACLLTLEGCRQRRLRALRPAAADAYEAGEYVGQESFVTASEALALADAAGIKAGSRMLDLCCGTGGLARHLTASIGCRVLGVDRSLTAVRLAQKVISVRSVPPRAGFLVADATRLPLSGPFDA